MADTFARVKHVVGSTAAWAANPIVLGDGEIGVERVSGSDIRIKIGDGTTAWGSLAYASSSSTGINTAVQTALDAKVAKAGDTMTGLLVLSANPTVALGAATKQYVDAINTALTTSIGGKLALAGGTMTGTLALAGDPSSALHATTKQYTDAAAALKLNKAGDTMTGALTLAADPSSALHAATKQYVDGGAYQTVVGGSATYAGKVVKLNSAGILDSSLLPVSATYLGTVNLTVAYALSGTFTAGNYYSVSATGTIDSSWSATRINGSPTTCGAGQFIIFNANGKWDLVGDTASSAAITGKLDKAGGTMTGALILAADPVVALGAATKQYADTMVAKAGGTMTGLLVLSANPSAALGAATKQYVDSAGTTLTAAYQAADSAQTTTLNASIATKLALAGGTLTGALILAADPAVALGAATKQYVDTATAGAALRANNLSDLASVATARTNLGLGSIALLSTIANANITNSAVTYAKMQNVSATARLLGRKTAAAGVVEEVSLSELLDFIGSAAQGDILFRGATAWQRLAAGVAGQVLQANGAGADPTWVTPSSSGSDVLASVSAGAAATLSISVGSLTAYRQLYITWNGLSNTSSATRQMTLDGVTFGPSGSTAATTYDGWMQLDLATGMFYGSGASSAPAFGSFAQQTSYSRASTALVFGWSGTGNFDAGTFTVYGVK
jgi:hypothetical protein